MNKLSSFNLSLFRSQEGAVNIYIHIMYFDLIN